MAICEACDGTGEGACRLCGEHSMDCECVEPETDPCDECDGTGREEDVDDEPYQAVYDENGDERG